MQENIFKLYINIFGEIESKIINFPKLDDLNANKDLVLQINNFAGSNDSTLTQLFDSARGIIEWADEQNRLKILNNKKLKAEKERLKAIKDQNDAKQRAILEEEKRKLKEKEKADAEKERIKKHNLIRWGIPYIMIGLIYYLISLKSTIIDTSKQYQSDAGSPKPLPPTAPGVKTLEATGPEKIAHATQSPKREIPPPKEPTQSQQTRESSSTPVARQSPIQLPAPRNSPAASSNPSSGTEVLSFDAAKRLADQGDARAQAIVSIYYAIGYKTDKDPAKAAEYALLSAKQRNPLGIYRVAAMMENGDGFEKNPDEAKRLKVLAFEGLNSMSGDPYAMTALGVMVFRGEGGLRQDREMAVKLYKKAADLGYAPAQYNYSAALALGQGTGVSMQESNRYWQMAYDQNYPLALKGPPEGLATSIKSDSRSPSAERSRNLPTGILNPGSPGFVKSPYAPGAGFVDVQGMKRGDTAKCPYTGNLFIVP
jgi:hypothetical protein